MTAEALLIDIGNTTFSYCHAGSLQRGEIVSQRHGDYQPDALMDMIWQKHRFQQVLLASVYHAELTGHIEKWCRLKNISCRVAASRPQAQGLINGYNDFRQLGVDRWLSMLGIWCEARSGFFLVSCGTAVTFDQVNDEGEHLGGVIIPGFEMMQSCLKKGTVGIDNRENNPEIFPGLAKNTENALANGSLMAISAVIDKLIMQSGLDSSQGFISGGDAKMINAFRRQPIQLEQNAVLKGLQVTFEGST